MNSFTVRRSLNFEKLFSSCEYNFLEFPPQTRRKYWVLDIWKRFLTERTGSVTLPAKSQDGTTLTDAPRGVRIGREVRSPVGLGTRVTSCRQFIDAGWSVRSSVVCVAGRHFDFFQRRAGRSSDRSEWILVQSFN